MRRKREFLGSNKDDKNNTRNNDSFKDSYYNDDDNIHEGKDDNNH